MSIYDTIGVRTFINAKGTSTRVSGALLAPEVTAAMQEAAQYCVDMAEIQAAASEGVLTGVHSERRGNCELTRAQRQSERTAMWRNAAE